MITLSCNNFLNWEITILVWAGLDFGYIAVVDWMLEKVYVDNKFEMLVTDLRCWRSIFSLTSWFCHQNLKNLIIIKLLTSLMASISSRFQPRSNTGMILVSHAWMFLKFELTSKMNSVPCSAYSPGTDFWWSIHASHPALNHL